MKKILVLVVGACAALAACGSDDSMSNMNMGSSSGSTGTSTSGVPTIKAVNKMQNVLHVQWTNPTPACESVEGERMAQMADGTMMEEYKVAFTVPGTVDNKMDTGATEDMKYTYRLRCKGATKYSDELSGNPKQ